jgi:hypothetical protein
MEGIWWYSYPGQHVHTLTFIYLLLSNIDSANNNEELLFWLFQQPFIHIVSGFSIQI